VCWGASLLQHWSAHLVVAGPEAPPHILVIKHLHFKAEVLLHVLEQKPEP
jgi:hypothetical protein